MCGEKLTRKHTDANTNFGALRSLTGNAAA